MRNSAATPDLAKRRREVLTQFCTFLGFSALEISHFVFNGIKLEKVGDWIILVGAVLFPIMTIVSWRSLRNNWTAEEEDRAATRTLGYIVLIPIILVAVIVTGYALFSLYGWLATIPSWAAVIILLLILIYLK